MSSSDAAKKQSDTPGSVASIPASQSDATSSSWLQPRSSGAAAPAASAASQALTTKITAGSQCTIAEDTDIRGRVHIGDQTVVHPKAIIQALDPRGSIVIGAQCIVEEYAQIVNRHPTVMQIGEKNLFEVGARVEAQSVGSHNVFSCKSRTRDNVRIADFCTVGVACVAQPPVYWEPSSDGTAGQEKEEGDVSHESIYTFPSRTVIYGEQSSTRIWSGNGVRQADALHAKHLDHLRKNLTEVHDLRII